MDTAKRTSTEQASTVYDGFISYSHAGPAKGEQNCE